MMQNFDAIVLGAGAAGLMCAIEAGKRGRRVLLLERAERIGKKVLISGGGRCNFTNLQTRPENFLSANPHFSKSALARYTPQDFIALVEKHKVRYHEKHKGQLFCDGSAREIVAMLEEECRKAGVTIVVSADVRQVRRADDFVVETGSEEYRAPALVVATGGLSIPKIGATSFGYELARQFGMKVRECRPALVPLTFGVEDRRGYGDLAGVSAEVTASSDGQAFRDKMLITHRGLSGPVILQMSSYWQQGDAIAIDLAPGREWVKSLLQGETRKDASSLKGALRAVLPQRLADRWIELHAPKDWTNHSLSELERLSHRWMLRPGGTEGYEKAEVTAGGVDTDGLSAKTMESRGVPGLYFVGEVVDV
ncbi:MAG TPA: NAD(P)/FAD-dependent oxidoreductase, partial [Terriglobales bacterium]|nr:NAD(P)/FAD-dependent oxidoreductase [Terriglobales bacterium]